jgi:hypothetical protein
MTAQESDWRLRGQERYLSSAKLMHSAYQPYRQGWEHDHCSFCWKRFCVDDPDCEKQGYCTEDRYYWICEPCFTDFRDMFHFQLDSGDESLMR